MRRLAISVEGSTEREFVRQVLQPHLWGLEIDIRPVVVTTKRLVSGPNQKGGSISVDRAVPEIRRLLPNFDAVTTLYDFYGFVGKKPGDTAEDIETRISDRLGNPYSFIPYVQVHEFEAILFSGPGHVASAFLLPEKAVDLTQIVEACGGPEGIDDNPISAPSKRLQAIFPSYDKAFHGPAIALAIGLPAIRAACPRFAAWMSRLEAL